jgi:NitT/TauT family transport system ATP-binding protein
MLRAGDLCKRYPDGNAVLENVSFELAADETLAVVGPSGCGKTTLLYVLAGLTQCDCGTVSLDGAPIAESRRDVSIILQDYGLLPWKSVVENVALGLKVRGVARGERLVRAAEQLQELGIHGREGDYPANLSGGEQQRVAIARAFVTEPRLMLLDEPFSSLDALTREKLQGTMLEVWKRKRVPYVLVTHSLEEAVFLGRRILVLSGRPARPVACFDNPGFGSEGYRDTESYYAMLRELRRAVEAAW